MTNSRYKLEHLLRKTRLPQYIAYVVLFLTLVIIAVYSLSHNAITKARAVKQQTEIEVMNDKLLSEYKTISSDLFYFTQNKLTESVLLTKNAGDLHQLTSVMMKISSLHKNYDQIRLLDKQGNEVIRVNQNGDLSLTIVPTEKLQNKSERYYYKTTAKLSSGEVYISKFDLNIERSHIETPIKPVIRFSTPIYSESGHFLGIGVINYLGKNALMLLSSLNRHEGDVVYLLNEQGYYLNHQDTDKNWLFMYPEKQQQTFSGEFPKLWMQINGKDSGSVNHNGDEYYFLRFQLKNFPLHNVVSHESLYILMKVPEATITKEYSILISGIFTAFIMIFPMALFLVYKLANSQDEQDRLISKLNFDAFHDALTGLYNRQAIFEYLTKSIGLSQRRKAPLSVGFIDVNNLKEMNDRYGHEAGDELISGVASAIALSIRQSDYAARLGGDEFLIVFIDSDKQQTYMTMKRIQEHYRLLGHKKGREWSLCFGCSQLLDAGDSTEAMIERADKEMYKQKVLFKHKQESVDLKVSKKALIDIRTHSMNLGSTTKAVQSLDVNGMVIAVSPEWMHLTGYDSHEAIGRHFTEFLDSQSLKKVEENFPQLKGYGYVNNVQLMIKRKDGTIISVVLNGTSKYDDEGQFVRTFCEITPASTND